MKKDTKFYKGMIPWNKGLQKKLNISYIIKKYNEGYSSIYISKKLGVSDKTIINRLKRNNIKIRRNHSKITRKKISDCLKQRKIKPIKRYTGKVWNKGLTKDDERVRKNIQGLLKNRKTQVLPKKDTSIERKIQRFLRLEGIKFEKHQYLNIKHGYQCDILIPKQKRINNKIILECYGDYWHNYPLGRPIDKLREKEIIKKGWDLVILWENEIKSMDLKKFKEIIDV